MTMSQIFKFTALTHVVTGCPYSTCITTLAVHFPQLPLPRIQRNFDHFVETLRPKQPEAETTI